MGLQPPLTREREAHTCGRSTATRSWQTRTSPARPPTRPWTPASRALGETNITRRASNTHMKEQEREGQRDVHVI